MRKNLLNLVCFSLLVLGGTMTAQTTVKGYVYEDENENGKKERREEGISRVAVSNGRDVVLTNDDGKYELPIGVDNPVFVIKPSGYNTPVDENNLPQFFYLHKPHGSPEHKFEGVAPTGKLPRSVDFGLIPSKEEDEFKALVFGDPQAYSKQQIEFFAKGVVAEVEGINGFSLGISLGDLVGDNPNLFDPYIETVKKIGLPWYNVMGNHDMNFGVEADSLSDESFEKHFGPATYSFNYGNAHFIILDDILYPDPRNGKGYWGGFTEKQMEFIKNDLKHVPRDMLVIMAFHIPISEVDDRDLFRDDDRQQLFDLLKDFPNTLSLSAHTHIQRQDFFSKEDGWRQEKPHHHYNVGTTSGDWYSGKLDKNGVPLATMRDGTPKGYAVLTVKGNGYLLDYKVAGESEDYKMNIFHPRVVQKSKRTKAGMYANFFIGSEKDKLRYRINKGEWRPMTYVHDYDRSYLHLLHEWDFAEELPAGRRGSEAVDSRHLWRAPVQSDLEPGEHTVEIEATDMFGRTFTQEANYRIVE